MKFADRLKFTSVGNGMSWTVVIVPLTGEA
jgi:hypothetical protein